MNVSASKSYRPRLKAIAESQVGLLPLSEIFYSIQGEGRWAGTPSAFVRFLYCDFGCVWCDTRYTWDERHFDDGGFTTIERIVNSVVSAVPVEAHHGELPHIVFTGGEPLIHQKKLLALIAELRARRFTFFEIETHGAITPSLEMLRAVSWWNVSPKLSNSLLPLDKRFNSDAIAKLAETGRADFKFVVRSLADVDEMETTFGAFLPKEHIFLMPEGARRSDQLKAMAEVAGWCVSRGYCLSPRLHTIIWNNRRGI